MSKVTDNSKIIEILNRKMEGTDCTEEESGEIKGWLRDTFVFLQSDDLKIVEQIQELFPCEYGEWSEEDEKNFNQ